MSNNENKLELTTTPQPYENYMAFKQAMNFKMNYVCASEGILSKLNIAINLTNQIYDNLLKEAIDKSGFTLSNEDQIKIENLINVCKNSIVNLLKNNIDLPKKQEEVLKRFRKLRTFIRKLAPAPATTTPEPTTPEPTTSTPEPIITTTTTTSP